MESTRILKRSVLFVVAVGLLAGCGGSEGSKGESGTSSLPTSPTPTAQEGATGPPASERVEGLAVGEPAELSGGAIAATVDAAYKVTPREGDFRPGKGGSNWMFFSDLQKSGRPALLLAVTIASEAGTNADPRFDTTSFSVKDENGYTMPLIVTPPALDPQHPSQGWQGTVAPGQTRGATIGTGVPTDQDQGLAATYQFSGDPRTPRATWEIGDVSTLPEAPLP